MFLLTAGLLGAVESALLDRSARMYRNRQWLVLLVNNHISWALCEIIMSLFPPHTEILVQTLANLIMIFIHSC